MGDLFAAEQARHLLRVNQLRFVGASSFLALFFVLAVVCGKEEWATNFPFFSVYCVLAGAVLLVGRRPTRWGPFLALAIALLDMPAIYFIQLSTYPHSNASGVAGFNLGIYVFLLLLAALTLDIWALSLTTTVGILLEARLQSLAGVSPGAIVAAGMVLTITALGCAYARARMRDIIARLAATVRHEQMMQELARKTREQSYADSLTGLYNRRGFLTYGEEQLANAGRAGIPYVVLFFELDGLKRINDELGHAQGDGAICDTATVLRDTLRDSDLIARLGGDEFVALAADSAGASEGGARIIARVVDGVVKFNGARTRPYRLQISAGASLYDPLTPKSLEALMTEADAAMYLQKKSRPSASGSTVVAV